MKRTIALWLSIMLCLLLAACSQDSSDLLKVPVSANDCKGKNCQDVVNDISAAGFVNIQAKTIEDLVTGWLTKDGEVEEVTIDGDGSFRAGDTFDKTAAIIVSYHTFPSKNEEVTTDSAGHSEISTPPENYSTETEKWLASSEYADCVADGKFPAVPGNNPYGSGVNESSRNPSIYYLNSSMRGPWGKETEYGDYEYYIPSGKYLVMNASNPKQYDYVATACNVYVGNPENDDEYATYSFSQYGEIQEIFIPDGYYVSLTVSGIITLEPLEQ